MAITRRQFLRRSSLATAGTLFAPGFLGNPFLRRAMAANFDKFFIVIQLDGGNDGLNTVTPYADGASGTLRAHYETHRHLGNGGLRLLPGELNATLLTGTGPVLDDDPNTATPMALHPGFSGLMPAWAAGDVAVIQGCGYPDYNLSHEESRQYWQTGNPQSYGPYTGNGWLGRDLALSYGGLDVPAVTIDRAVAYEMRQTTTSVLAINRLRDFGFPYDDFDSGDDLAKRQAFLALQDAAIADLQATKQYLGNNGSATLSSSESYPSLHDLYETDRSAFSALYDAVDTGFARDMREVAKIIYGVKTGVPNINARFFQLGNGGYDTHSNQDGADPNGQHYGLHRELGDTLAALRTDLTDMGVWEDTVVMTWSEFSRRIPQNGSGTDHGSQGPMLVVGGGVTGGIYGNHPNITPAVLDENENTVYSQAPGDPFRSTDFRDVYGTILKHWLGVIDEQDILASILELDTGDQNLFWTAANFDMGFLV